VARPAARQDQPTKRASGYRLYVSFRKSLRLALGGIPRGRERIFIWLIVRPERLPLACIQYALSSVCLD